MTDPTDDADHELRDAREQSAASREILAALALMYVIYFPHGGGLILLTGGYVPPSLLDSIISSQLVGVFASVYGFVRGWDNIITELRALCPPNRDVTLSAI